jgi:hypothetical protein
MADHESTWSRVIAMAHAHYPEDPDRAHLDALDVFEVGQTANYACEDELYGPYREGIGEAAARMVVALECGRRPSGCSIGEQRRNPGGQCQAR